jgi:hypothetical protein
MPPLVGEQPKTVWERSMQRPNERFSSPEFEPDPQLQLSQGRASGLQIAIVTLACSFILGLMIYGLNQPVSENTMASAPPAGETTGAAPAAPQSGGNVAGGKNAAPKSETAPQEQQPAQQPVPQQTKPSAVEDDATR